MHDTLRFWLDRGVDGFRMDVVHLLGKDLTLDDPPVCQERVWGHVPFNDHPRTHEHLRAIRSLLDQYATNTGAPRVGVGEVYLLDEEAMTTYHGDGDELHLCFNFRFLWTQFDVLELRARIERSIDLLRARGAWPTWVLSNHDVPRHRQRYGGGELAARMAAIMLLALPGTPFLYQGEELGLLDAEIAPERMIDPGHRDGCRAPIPWDEEPLHGWTDRALQGLGLPFPPEADTRNVASQRADDRSILHLYRRLLLLRRSTPALRWQRGQATVLAE
jgi:alpha-glucosidase